MSGLHPWQDFWQSAYCPLTELLCASERATLVADSLTRERIAACTNGISNKVNGKQQSSDNSILLS